MELGKLTFVVLAICVATTVGQGKRATKPIPTTKPPLPSWEGTIVNALPEQFQPYVRDVFQVLDTALNKTVVVFHELCDPCNKGYGAFQDFVANKPYVRGTLTTGCTLLMPVLPVLVPVCQALVASGIFLIEVTPSKYVCGALPVCWGVDQNNMTMRHVTVEEIVSNTVEALHNISQLKPVFHPVVRSYAAEITSSPTYSYFSSIIQELEEPLLEILGIKDSNDFFTLLTTQLPIEYTKPN